MSEFYDNVVPFDPTQDQLENGDGGEDMNAAPDYATEEKVFTNQVPHQLPVTVRTPAQAVAAPSFNLSPYVPYLALGVACVALYYVLKNR